MDSELTRILTTLQELLDAMTARCDSLTPTIVSLTAERNQLAKEKAAIAKERDMLKGMIQSKLTAASRDRVPTAAEDDSQSAVVLDKDQNKFQIPKDFKAAKAFFLGVERITAKYQSTEDEDYEVQETVDHSVPPSDPRPPKKASVVLDEAEADVPPALPDSSPPGSPPPVPESEPPVSPTPLHLPDEDADSPLGRTTTDAVEAVTPPYTTKTSSQSTAARRSLFGGLAASLRKRFNTANEERAQEPQRSVENPWFGGEGKSSEGGADVNSEPAQINFMSASEDARMVDSNKGKLSKKQRRLSKKSGVPSRANHDASVELRRKLQEAERAVQVKTRELETARWVNTRVTKQNHEGSSTARTTRGSTGSATDPSKPTRPSSGYTKGMRVKKGKTPQWRKAVEEDIAREKERLRKALEAQANAPPPPPRSSKISCSI